MHLFVPESPVRSSGRVDGGGALLLGGGLAAVLGYVSLGQDLGWLSAGMIVVLVAGVAALAWWAFLALRVDEPIVDIRALSRPLVLTLAVVLAAGSFQSVLQLTSLIAQVPPELGLGYGLADGSPVALLFAAPAPGIMLGGIVAGWLATRIGSARTLLGGIAIGTVGTFTMLAGVSSFPMAIASVALLGMAAGAIGTSAFNLATGLAPLFVLAAVTATMLVRKRFAPRRMPVNRGVTPGCEGVGELDGSPSAALAPYRPRQSHFSRAGARGAASSCVIMYSPGGLLIQRVSASTT